METINPIKVVFNFIVACSNDAGMAQEVAIGCIALAIIFICLSMLKCKAPVKEQRVRVTTSALVAGFTYPETKRVVIHIPQPNRNCSHCRGTGYVKGAQCSCVD